MNGYSKRLLIIESAERQRIAAEFDRIIKTLTPEEIDLIIADGEPYKNSVDYDSLTLEELKAIVRCESNGDGSRPSIQSLKEELAYLTEWLTDYRGKQMTAEGGR